MRGLFQSERANMLRMGEVNEVDHQAMQHMLTSRAIDWNGFGEQIASETDALLGGSAAVLIIDESAFAKKGESSAGVSRQWNGRLGKVDNCQVGVFASLCQNSMASLIDVRLYLPEHWVSDSNRCKKAAIPEACRYYHSKCEIALSMIETAKQRGVRFGYVGIDGGYGKDPAFLRGVDKLGCAFVADVHCRQMVYLEDPMPCIPAWNGRGRQPKHLKAQSEAIRVDQWVSEQPDTVWRRIKLREGEKGILEAEYLHALVWVWDGSEKQAHRWHLLARREAGASEISHYCLSNASLETPLQELAQVQTQRFFIEHCFHEAKSECGMDDYQVRRWDAWHHHMALVMLATLFLVKQKMLGRKQWPMLSFNDLVTALAHMLPQRQLTTEDLADIIHKRHRRRLSAKKSSARRKVAFE
ncbi:MAG: IS701 family transposase [Burkholderiales bacterium]|nr:IS701 family transposase [Burkholderiales bacterium]MDR4518651.1 IS701 family transposase [Nitrosomonas sp.]